MHALRSEFEKLANPKKARLLQGFFKTGKGEYAEGDVFLGVMVPETRKLVKQFSSLSLPELQKSISSKYHEERLAALLILVERFRKAGELEKKKIFKFYLKNAKRVNNWDLVDLTAPCIVGGFLLEKDKRLLFKLAKSKNLWERRISILASFTFIKNGNFEASLKLAEYLLNDEEDLIHKAVGWMLREIGKKSKSVEVKFLQKHASKMPRTMLRYAIEKFPEKERKKFLSL